MEIPVGRSVEVEVPATSANLGPGFDCFGLALNWRDRCRFEVVDSGWSARVSGEGAGEVPADARHLVLASARRGLAQLGHSVPGLRLTASNTIPHGRGLGSSSAAIAAGLIGAAGLVGSTTEPGAWMELATEIEGHPDNVAAALYGGFVLAFRRVGSRPGTVGVASVPVHPDIRVIVLVPELAVSTARARSLLPASVPHGDAAADAGRAALLVQAVSREPDLLFEATADWLHQGYRAPVMPRSAALLESLRQQGCAAVISGAGPTVLVLGTEPELGPVRALADEAGFRTVATTVGAGARVLGAPFARMDTPTR